MKVRFVDHDFAGDGSNVGLSEQELKALWRDARPWMNVDATEVIDNAGSGDDPAAARAYLYWLHRQLAADQPVDDETKAYSVASLARYLDGGMTLGQAFGVERKRRGNPPVRSGGVQAVNGLIQYLHENRGYPLGESAAKASAFEVAAALLKSFFHLDRSPYTLRDQYWKKRDKRESS